MLLQTFFIVIYIGRISQSFWFSYIIFLVFIGGLLILFIYTISLIFNKKFFLIKNYILILTIFILIIVLFILFLKFSFYLYFNNNEIFFINFIKTNLLENSLNLNKLFNFPNFYINLLIIRYLFFILIVSVKITNFYFGPIRIKF